VNLSIDGKNVVAEAEQTVLDAALRNGINIPHLCTHPSLKPFGACRMCLVEIEGMRGYPTSCTTPVAEGMVVKTNTEALKKLRRNILGLTMLEHPSACLVCGKRELCQEFRPKPEKAGRTTGCHTCNNMDHCEVRVLSSDLGLQGLPVPPLYHERPLERGNPFIDRDLNLCILCGRCVRICKHHQGGSVIDLVNRGSHTQIGEAFGHNLKEAGCTFCGACVDVCPTGTLSDRFGKWYGQPEKRTGTSCQLCDEACALVGGSLEGKLIQAVAAQESAPLCVLGRFALAEFLSGVQRLRVPQIRVGEVLREVDMREALQSAANALKDQKGAAFALVYDTTSTLEERHLFKKFTKEVMASENYIEVTDAKTELPDGVKALITTGNLVTEAALRALDTVIVLDCFPSAATLAAHAVFPSAVLTEVSGSMLDGDGVARPLREASLAPGHAQADWKTLCALATSLEATGFDFDSTDAIAQAAGLDTPQFRMDRDAAPDMATDTTNLPTHFRGHALADVVPGLIELAGGEPCPVATPEAAPEKAGRFQILAKREIVPNTHEFVIHAPEVARHAKAGQFCIAMADKLSERVPYTLCDWDAEAGTITLVVQEKGQSSRKLILLRQGECLAHLVGPLGEAIDVKNYGNVVIAGGCYGVGASAPVAKALRAAGNHVTVIVEARSHYIHYHAEKLAGLADDFIQTTIDGSNGKKGHAVDVVADKIKAGEKIDLVVAIGCPFMMMLTSRETKPHDIPTLAALNPIMLDGTGMCGACRLSVGDETKFACVDGPFFDAHLVDWDEVRNRREAYSNEEIQSVGVSAPVTLIEEIPGKHKCRA
jgi:NADH dehydrogenase/NADH:ubiquinone oxidoreductase subunit G/NAD(P)H-flavin reductase